MALTLGQTKIVTALNNEHVPTMDDAEYWSQGVVGVLLRSPTVKGVFTQKNGGDRVIDGYFPVLVPPAKWQRVQDAIKSRATSGGSSRDTVLNLFTALQRCMYCGSATRYLPTNPSSRTYSACGRTRRPDAARSVPYVAAEKALLDRLMNAQHNGLAVKLQ
jgi:recombinase